MVKNRNNPSVLARKLYRGDFKSLGTVTEIFETEDGRKMRAFYNPELDSWLGLTGENHQWFIMYEPQRLVKRRRGRPQRYRSDHIIITVFRWLREKKDLQYDAAIALVGKLFGINRRTVLRHWKQHKAPLKLYNAVMTRMTKEAADI